MPFAGTFAPSGWALANGQLLPINQNQALFALLATTYGGDGRTTFALPDLRDRTVVGTSTSVTIGSQLGANSPTVTAAELPTGPNPLPPAGTTADMILRARTVAVGGQYEIYDIGNNAILAGYSVGSGRNRLAVRRPRRLLRQRHHRHAVAQQQHRRLRGLRHQQQQHHQRRLPRHCRA